MKLSEGVEWAIHCTVLAAQTEVPIRRETFARHYDLPEAYLAKHLHALVRAGVLHAVSGPRGGYRLARPAHEITVLDIVEAIDGSRSPFACTEIRQRGLAAASPRECRRPCSVASIMVEAHAAWRGSLQRSTVADIVERTPASVRRRNARRFPQPSLAETGHNASARRPQRAER